MKRIKRLFVLLIFAFILPSVVNASSANISIKTSGQAVVGNTITATMTVSSGSNIGTIQYLVSYDSSKLTYTGGDSLSDLWVMDTKPVKSKTFTFKFKVTKSGNASINVGSYQIGDYDNETNMSASVSNATVKIMTQAELEATYSKNNNLKGISVGEYELSPAFSKDVLEYSVKVPSTVDTVEISATKEDSTASIDGLGTKEVVEGSNNFEIVVTAQNGSTKTYKINVVVEDINPIELSIENTNYTVVKRADNLETPKGFEATTITINEIEIPAFKSELLDLIVVGIKDSDGKISYAIYEDGKYVLYNDITSNNLTIYLLKFNEKIEDLVKTTTIINDKEIECYKVNKNSKFAIVYGKNVETGDESYYVYDELDKTFQRYNTEQIDELKDTIQTYLYVIYGFGGALTLLLLCLFISSIAKHKAKKKRKKALMLDNNKQELSEEIENVSKKEKKKKNKDLFEEL